MMLITNPPFLKLQNKKRSDWSWHFEECFKGKINDLIEKDKKCKWDWGLEPSRGCILKQIYKSNVWIDVLELSTVD